jgi:DNA-binding response OmpR family regulator
MSARIVVIEDDADLREAICLMLDFEGHDVSAFSNAREAIRRIEAGLPVDVVLLDLMMPIMNGWEFCEHRAASATLARVPVIVITARQSVTPPIGVSDVLLKPFDADELQGAIVRAMSRPTAADSL